ncbi:MAG: (d)CMP kinase [Gammaproteobacteria bacterium]|nr:(d)CMP kinase [Gammaproteobacteria bacterium]
MTNDVPVIAIDGPAASGKGTIAIALAEDLGWHRLDSGLLYRTVAYVIDQWNLDYSDPETIQDHIRNFLSFSVGENPPNADSHKQIEFPKVSVHVQIQRLTGSKVWYNAQEITPVLRSEHISRLSSYAARIPTLRNELIPIQRELRQPPGLVAEGRDMGTVLFPTADLKIFLTADVAVRAQRRFDQYAKDRKQTYEEILEDLRERDRQDMHRGIAPLKKAEDAIEIDCTYLSVKCVVEKVLQAVPAALKVA